MNFIIIVDISKAEKGILLALRTLRVEGDSGGINFAFSTEVIAVSALLGSALYFNLSNLPVDIGKMLLADIGLKATFGIKEAHVWCFRITAPVCHFFLPLKGDTKIPFFRRLIPGKQIQNFAAIRTVSYL